MSLEIYQHNALCFPPIPTSVEHDELVDAVAELGGEVEEWRYLCWFHGKGEIVRFAGLVGCFGCSGGTMVLVLVEI